MLTPPPHSRSFHASPSQQPAIVSLAQVNTMTANQARLWLDYYDVLRHPPNDRERQLRNLLKAALGIDRF